MMILRFAVVNASATIKLPPYGHSPPTPTTPTFAYEVSKFRRSCTLTQDHICSTT
jgi:hypothetical protein